jgi:hypothetical protein
VAWTLTWALAVVTSAAAMVTFVFGGELAGTPVMNGSCRGTALVVLVGGVPTLVVAAAMARRGSARATFVWFGLALYVLYNAVLITVGEPLNRFFLLYEAWIALAAATVLALAFGVDVRALAARCRPSMPARGFGTYVLVIAVLNALAWLARIVPATLGDRAADLLDGTGVSMVPTYFGDLAFWLPLLTVGAVWLRRRRPWGFLLGGGGLVMWAIEGFTVAVDQWFGHRADPASTVASAALVGPFAVLGLVGLVVAVRFLHHVESERSATS